MHATVGPTAAGLDVQDHHACSPAGQLHAQLLQVHSLLSKVAGMGPLVSLLKAHHVREEFLRTNRDLLDTFGILARGEQLLVRTGCCCCCVV